MTGLRAQHAASVGNYVRKNKRKIKNRVETELSTAFQAYFVGADKQT